MAFCRTMQHFIQLPAPVDRHLNYLATARRADFLFTCRFDVDTRRALFAEHLPDYVYMGGGVLASRALLWIGGRMEAMAPVGMLGHSARADGSARGGDIHGLKDNFLRPWLT